MEIRDFARLMLRVNNVFEDYESPVSDEDRAEVLKAVVNFIEKRIEVSSSDFDDFDNNEDDDFEDDDLSDDVDELSDDEEQNDDDAEEEWLSPEPEKDYDALIETKKKPKQQEQQEEGDVDGSFESLGIDDADKPSDPKPVQLKPLPKVNDRPKSKPLAKPPVDDDDDGLDDEDLVF